MATLILGTVGQIVGGPIGGAIGSVAGQYIDRTILFAPRPRHGPRLGDLGVQTSSYGSAIPKLFGTMRVAGTVIWATDLVEQRSTSGGKGRPKTVAYSYSASFAVAISARPIRSVGRIWADGKLLRGAGGDFKSATVFRLHPGSEDQAADPLIVSAEGAALAPAYRGIAYAVFEHMQLEDFGNRIPSLSFEIEADPGAVAIGAVAEALAAGAIEAGPTPALAGYAASGDSVRGAIEALADVVPLSLADGGTRLLLTSEGGAAVAIGADEELGRRTLVRRGAGQLPGEVSIAYHEPERDYQVGLQRAVRGDGGRTTDRRALPAALSAGAAKALAEFRLDSLWSGRASATVELGWRRAALRPGDRIVLAGEAGIWKVTRWTLGPMTAKLELVRTGTASPPVLEANPGRPVAAADLVHGPTTVRLYDLPLGDGDRPLIVAMAAGAEPGWRRAALTTSLDQGASWQAAGATAAPAVLGVAIDALGPGGSALIDAAGKVEVELASEAMWLESRDDDALIAGANLAVLGGELIQFGSAEPLGGRRFRLSRLLRGRRGTEWAAAAHAAGEDFALVDAETMVALDVPAGSLGGEARVLAAGIGDGPAGASATIAIEGESLRPPSPVHLQAVRTGAGDIALSWVRRSRRGWTWTSGGDTPLGEEGERYRLTLSGAGFERIVESHAAAFLYTAEAQAADGAAPPIQIRLVQIGTFASSRPALLTID